MDLNNQLLAISPIDGRYATQTQILKNYFSEYALIKYRIRVEIEYFIALCKIPLPQLKEIDDNILIKLKQIYLSFSLEDALRVKEIEKTTNHDVKAVEYFIKEKFNELNIEKYKEFIHFGLTSQDINNTAIPLSLLECYNQAYLPKLEELQKKLTLLSEKWKNIPMLARTHGQPASPTKLGKEFRVFTERIDKQKELLKIVPFTAKFAGATGNFNAHKVAYPNIDWKTFATQFLNSIGLKLSFPTTQIEHYDNIAALFDATTRINNIIIDFDRDIWTYISMDYFKQKINPNEVGSSAMPHKVNPIDFENSEGNLTLANAIFNYISSKLPISRLQRDLTDSTVLRNVGVPIAHTIISFNSTIKGLNKLVLNEEKLAKDLDDNWAVVAEAIQTILRRENYKNPYETLKGLTRGNKKITQEVIHNFIDQLEVSQEIKQELKNITPHNYTGIA